MKKRKSEAIFCVTPSEEGVTLLSFLREHCQEAPSVKAIKRAIENKGCTVNGRIETFSSHPVLAGDKIAIDLSVHLSKPLFSEAKWSVLYEDAVLYICNKPAGALSQNKNYTLVHRLDKETSGVLIFAKTPEIKEKMIEIFRKREIAKTYLALVEGALSKDRGEINAPLGKIGEYQGQTIYGVVALAKGKSALTRWKCLKKNAQASLLQLEPVTGRTHQLRVHLSHLHHPIIGDVQYGKHFKTLSLCRPKRHLLHAYAIAFAHPISGAPLKVIAPIPKDFKEALQQLQLGGL